MDNQRFLLLTTSLPGSGSAAVRPTATGCAARPCGSNAQGQGGAPPGKEGRNHP